ncbi:class I SAM-dependent methyltransferase [Aeromicrobium ginsengisoli]|uniref:Methyltransferase domain-containing protein n=1 Tax=Aeromicrobium ginsengisoli TaxID=363867 RepID=A0A5M4FIU4_9ACTN|nr:class I SAM-dependent methyltransferase [Aeromicrobium ginsengisoli]KAA1399892.1 methyltransferase domain-containing protein [Aeromicrobium ginsengisoli]
MFDYDAELIRYNVRLQAAADIGPDDRVLDIGCGAGQTSRQAARSAHAGSVVGVDVSQEMVDHARRLAADEGVGNVVFQHTDAQTHPFEPQRFTVAISRFGTMFFADPMAAFTNIGSALRPGARLVQVVWQSADRQPWVTAIREGVAADRPLPPQLLGGPFALADPAVIDGVLTEAGFTDVEIADVREPIQYGPDAVTAHEALIDLGMIEFLAPDLDEAATVRARDGLLTVLEAHDTGQGVWFDSACWLVTARRAV